MPPLQALVALHGLWLLALAPLTVWAVRKWPARRLKIVGCALTALGLAALALLIGYQMSAWYPSVMPSQQKYIGQRILFAVATRMRCPMYFCWDGMTLGY